MALRWLTRRLAFPSPETADSDGIVAVGGDCSPERLLLAYRSGIFPWPMSADLPLFWFSPDPRWVIEPTRAHIPSSLRKQTRRNIFDIRVDTAFDAVILACAATARPGQRGTWITDELRVAYSNLHRLGYAHSVEAWSGNQLVGGLYGVSLGRVFFGESMFTRAPDASKLAFGTLLGNLVSWNFALVDCQTRTDHLVRFGSVGWDRPRFLSVLESVVTSPTRTGRWTFDLDPVQALALIPG